MQRDMLIIATCAMTALRGKLEVIVACGCQHVVGGCFIVVVSELGCR